MSPFVRALDTGYSLAQYQHTVWTSREGAPTDIVGLATGGDGHLWMASPRGVWRFDGVDFTPVRSIHGMSLAAETPTALFGGPHGSIFLNFGAGHGSALVDGDRMVRFPECSLTPGAIDVDGVTWLVCNGQIARLVGDRILPLEPEADPPVGPVTMLARDSRGTVWAATATRLARRLPGASAFDSVPADLPRGAVPGADDTFWSAGPSGITVTRMAAGGHATSATRMRGDFSRVHIDRNGGLWAVDAEKLVHVGKLESVAASSTAPAPGSDVMTRTTGLGSDSVTALYEDDRGDIWLGTAAGLERFKDNYFFPVRIPGRALAASIAAGDDGSVWAANYTGRLMQITNGTIHSFDAIDGGVTSLGRDRDGTVWVAAEQGRMFTIRGGAIARAPDIPAEIHGSAVTDITRDIHGALWVGTTINGMVGTYANGKWTMPHGYGGLPDRWASRTILADDLGRVWASRHYDVMLLENGVATRFSAAQGLQVGDIYALSGRGARIWVGGSEGVAYFDGSRFRALKPLAQDAFSEVTGVLETPGGDLWVHEFSAAIRVPAAELAKQRKDPDYRVATERYDATDGLYGISPQLAARPSMVQATDGRIWFSTSEGIAAVDPRRARPAPHMPPVSVQGVVADGVEQDLSSPLVLEHRTKSVRFLYTAVSPSGAERLRFRYRLEGLDSEWTAAGSRRAITYNSLAPGQYRFRVESSDDMGNWGGNVTTFGFTVKPLWFETWSFRVAYLLAGLVCLWALYDWQMKRMTRGVRRQMRVQQMERERIARALHDTLLQGVQALIWRIHSIAAAVPEGDPVRSRLEAAIDIIQGLLVESRFRVTELRQTRSVPLPLSETLRNVLAGVVSVHPFSHSCAVFGTEVPVVEAVQIDISDIVREALANVAQHGRANVVAVTVEYSRWSLLVRVADDGIGFDPGIARRGRPEHWGIAGMRERARELGGHLHIRTGPGKGTEVMLRLRARKAYVKSPSTWLPVRLARSLRRATRGLLLR